MNSASSMTGLIDSGPAAGLNTRTKDPAKELNDRFLRLLVEQMKNQDPLNPLDNAQVTSQMAQINTVTGINGLNNTVGRLLEQFARLETMQAAQLAGRSVLVDGAAMTLGAEGPATAGIELNVPADSVMVEVRDNAGQVVREIALGRMNDGIQRFEWDGNTGNGARAAAGDYTFSVVAKNGGKDVSAAPLAARRVEGVRQSPDGVQLILAGLGPVAYSEIKQIL